MSFLKKLPLPLAGTALAFATLGNVLVTYHPLFKTLAGIISILLVSLVTLKIILLPKPCREAMLNPVVAGTMATYPMALMTLSTYLSKGPAAKSLWLFAILLHIGLILWFTNQFIRKEFQVKKVFTTWFIVYVGIVVASVSAPYHDQIGLGVPAFWFGLVTYLILLVLVVYRYLKVGQIPAPAQPTFVIFAAPASLLLAGYINSVTTKSLGMIYFLMVLSLLFFSIALVNLPRLVKLPFVPSFSGFTFPTAISALALKLTNGFFIKSGTPYPLLNSLVLFQVILAVALCLFVLVRYIQFMAEPHRLADPGLTK